MNGDRISIELAARLRNFARYADNPYALHRGVRSVPAGIVRNEYCDREMKKICCRRGATQRMLMRGREMREGHWNGKWKWGRYCEDFEIHSCAEAFRGLGRKEIGPKFRARDAGRPLDGQHKLCGDTSLRSIEPIPDKRLPGANAGSEHGLPAGDITCAFESFD